MTTSEFKERQEYLYRQLNDARMYRDSYKEKQTVEALKRLEHDYITAAPNYWPSNYSYGSSQPQAAPVPCCPLCSEPGWCQVNTNGKCAKLMAREAKAHSTKFRRLYVRKK